MLLWARPHGETAAVVDALTREHGRHAGLVRGGQTRRLRSILQPGNRALLQWNARLETHLGIYTVEITGGSWAEYRDDADAMAALASMIALLAAFLPEREPHPNLYAATVSTLKTLEEPDHWPTAYIHWELGLLRVLGYGLSLERCGATGTDEGLAYVSPRTGRAICRAAGAPYAGRLLVLPAFLCGGGAADREQWHQAMRLTGHFLERKVAASVHRPVPEARSRLLSRLAEPQS